MNFLQQIRNRFATHLTSQFDSIDSYLGMIQPAQNEKFGDYQANLAMPLAKQLGKAPRDVAADLISQLDLSDLCETPEIAGPGFINLTIRTDQILAGLTEMERSERLGISISESPRRIVIDYSGPNVAKPMHVGHLRSTVIGNSLARMLTFLGHEVITDNHIGDWGTQFGMILYGYRHFVNREAYEREPVLELGRLYRLVNQLTEYHVTRPQLEGLEWNVGQAENSLNEAEAEAEGNPKESKKRLKKEKANLESARAQLAKARKIVEEVDQNPELSALAHAHPEIHREARLETSRLHAGDKENLALWNEFLPTCLDSMNRVYRRLGIEFDHALGESYYQPLLAGVVEQLQEKQLATTSEGAMCVFLPDFNAPFIVQKQDGAYTYATTDLATIRYRCEEWKADQILYVVDDRQSEHFRMLFETSRLWGWKQVDLQHISFGTVMGSDGKPFKTRAGDAVGLESLLDEAVSRAANIVSENDDAKPNGPELDQAEREKIAEIVGIGGIKYADLHHNRESDYVFDWDKMLSMTGDTATYMQYAYARVGGIFRKAGIEPEQLATGTNNWQLDHPAERALALQLLRFEEALINCAQEYRPNLLTNYLYETAKKFSAFFDQCPVVKMEDESVRQSRLRLCHLTARVIRQGMELLGIETSSRM